MKIDPLTMCFGLNDKLDRKSFSIFLQNVGRQEFADLISTRFTGEEIMMTVDSFFDLMKKHLSKEEYHQHFLLDASHQHKE